MEKVTFSERKNARKITEKYVTGLHLSVPEIKSQMLRDPSPMTTYLQKNIPPYPNPVEFVVANVSHVTEENGHNGILESEQFKPPESDESWWSLHITDEEIQSAEKRFFEMNPPQAESEIKTNLMKKFTTSPLFNLKESRFGNYRYVFPLVDLMDAYREQNCGGQEPVVRIYETITYKQEIVYSVLIHSPEDNKEYPPLTESRWVRYDAQQDTKELQDTTNDNQDIEGKIIWKAQAICETHWYELLPEIQARKVQNRHEYYVWDQVSLVFHLPGAKALKFPRERLIEALESCELSDIDLSKSNFIKKSEERRKKDFEEAKQCVNKLKQELKDKTKKEDIQLEEQIGVTPKSNLATVNNNSKKRKQKTETSHTEIKLKKHVKSEDSFKLSKDPGEEKTEDLGSKPIIIQKRDLFSF